MSALFGSSEAAHGRADLRNRYKLAVSQDLKKLASSVSPIIAKRYVTITLIVDPKEGVCAAGQG